MAIRSAFAASSAPIRSRRRCTFARRSISGSISHRAVSPTIPPPSTFGDPELDDAFALYGDEEERVGALLEPLRETFLAWHRAHIHFHVTDDMVSIKRYSQSALVDDFESITADVEPGLTLARHIDGARGRLRPATVLGPHATAFESFAQANALALSTTPLAAWGLLGPRVFSVAAARVAPARYVVAMGLEHATPLPGSLLLRPAAPGTTPKTTTGDGAFDARFATEGTIAASQLNDEARSALVALHASGHDLVLTDRAIALRAPLGDEPYVVARHAGAAVDVLDAVERSFTQGAAYR
jgi:hypothetical protein